MGSSSYDSASGLEIPGIEAVIEYGDASKIVGGRIPGAFALNDRSLLEQWHVSQLSGLHDDPDGRDTRQSLSDRHGESAGELLYGGRTIGVTGEVKAGSIPAIREAWRRGRRALGTAELDLVLHPVGEVPLYINEVDVTDFSDFVDLWSGSSTSGPPTLSLQTNGYLTVGQVTVAGMPASTGTISISRLNPMVSYDGRDVVVGILVAQTAGAAAASLNLYSFFRCPVGSSSSTHSILVDTVTSPTSGKFYWLVGRVPAASVPRGATRVTFLVELDKPATSGTYTMQVSRPMVCLVDSSDPTPGYVGREVPGFESEGVVGRSRVRGPLYSVNAIMDPNFTSTIDDESMADNSGNFVSFVWAVSNSDPSIVTTAFTGSDQEVGGSTRSLVYEATKDATTTLRTMAFANSNVQDPNGLYPVSEGRSYRFTCSTNLYLHPTSDAVEVVFFWCGHDGTTNLGSTTATISPGEHDLSVALQPPAGALFISGPMFRTITSQSSAPMGIAVSSVCLADVTDHDPGSFSGVGEPTEEVETYVDLVVSTDDGLAFARLSTGVRRRIPRPFLLRRVRKTSDAKAPEQQVDDKYQRPYTMSMRAADPRIYVLDQRRGSIVLSGTPDLVTVQQMGILGGAFDTQTAGLPTPDGWTSEGSFITNPGGSAYLWSRDAWNYQGAAGSLARHPNDGVGIKTWNDLGAHGSNRPSSDLVTRYYRSSEGYTYGTPKVILGCAPSGYGGAGSTDNGSFNYQIDSFPNPTNWYYEDVRILLKRISSTTWLELRWNSVSHVGGGNAGINPANAPYAFELWCSHDSSGTLTTTRLATWDYVSYNSSSGLYPFVPSVDEMYLTAWMDSNDLVAWQLWRGYPANDTGFQPNRIESGSYQVPSQLASVVGHSVAGSTGMGMRISRASSEGAFETIADRPPFWHYFESSDHSVSASSIYVPVIGDIEVPYVVVLHGDVVDPIISISVPEFDGKPAATSTAYFTGTMYEDFPTTIDLTGSSTTIKDDSGNNAFTSLVSGGFEMLRPGVNVIKLFGKGWGDYSEHASITYRDALK
jgi:hypothetical protein